MQEQHQQWMNASSISNNDRIWHLQYDTLVCYGEQYGTCNVPRYGKCQLPDGEVVNLGYWLLKQRTDKNNSTLSKYRLQLLQTLVDQGSLDWHIDNDSQLTNNNSWYEASQLGASNDLPRNSTESTDETTISKLGQWQQYQRSIGRNDPLANQRYHQLQDMIESESEFLYWSRDK